MGQKKEKEAVGVLEQLFKRQPDYALARANRAISYENLALESKNPQEAIANVERAIALSPKDANSQRNLEYALQNGKIDVSSVEARVKYADALKAHADDVGAYVEYQLALKSKDDPAIQKKIDELISPEEAAKATAVGGAGAALLLSKIEINHSKDAAFNFEYIPYVRGIQRKVRSCWTAPASLGSGKVTLSFDTNAGGTISNLKVAKSCGDKVIDKQALDAVKNASPFKPLTSEVFFDVPVTMTLDAHGDESPTLYLNGEAKPDGLRFSTGAELNPLRAPKDVDARLQAKSDSALSQAAKSDQEIGKIEKQFGSDSTKLCPKLCAAANLYLQANEYKYAQERLEQAIAIAQKAKADDEQAAALTQLGILYYTTNRNTDAETTLKQAVNLFENAPTKDAAHLKSSMEAYAKVLYRLNRVPEANQIYDKIKAL